MTDRERQGWIIVAAIFATMFFIWGAINSSVLFFVPVLKYFGWTRAKLSIALSIGWVTGGFAGPFIGMLADRINPKWMMAIGATITGLLWLGLSRVTGFSQFFAINGLFGICVGASTTIPCTLIISSWFERQRGLAIGIAFAGATIGGVAMTQVVNRVIAGGGWRLGYVSLGLPVLFIVVPLVFLIVRPAGTGERGASNQAVPANEAAIQLPGLDIKQARATRSFWLICLIQFLGGATTGMGPHYAAYLTGIGYTATSAANIWSAYLLMTTIGAVLGGPMCDRIGARKSMRIVYGLGAFGVLGLLGAAQVPGLLLNIVAGGFALGALGVQMPLVIIEALGVKRFGSLMGVTGVFYTIGAALAPIAAGRIFDLTGSYAITIVSFIVMLVGCSIALLGCRSLAGEEAELARVLPSAAA